MKQIKDWLVRGDTHGVFTWMLNGCLNDYKPEETAIIILGDCGLDFYLNKTDERKKKEVDARGYYIYWLKGNHEERPSKVKGYKLIYDEEVGGEVWYDPRFPHLRAFKEYGIYNIKGYSIAVIGGAYSVDKHWRLLRAGLTEETNNPKKSGWFSSEQLTKEEMADAIKLFNGRSFDFVMSHTCPYDWQPTDLFLNGIDQSAVDNTIERWMMELRDKINVKYAWLWGHFHDDRIERPHAEMYYNDVENLDIIAERWTKYDETGELPWYIPKSPFFNN